MIVSKKIENLDIIIKEQIIFSLSDKEEYIKDFKELQGKGVIDKNSQFESKTWTITLSKVSKVLHFKIDEFFFKKITKGRNIRLSFDEFNIAYRRYIIELIYSDVARGSIYSFMSYANNFLEKTSFLDVNKIDEVRLKEINSTTLRIYEQLMTVLEFMDYEIPIEYQELYNETKLKEVKTRRLPRFTSIFKFIDVVEKFKENATEKELIRYYPVVLWHSISFIIPLRPSELLVTRYDCVFKKDDRFFLKIRRTIKKGAPNKYRVESFGIENYYKEEEVEINEKIYNEISVEYLVPYDSRHIAIINLILMGNEHYTVMKLSGHNKLKTTKGYYDHIEEYANAYSINYAKYLSGKSSDKMTELDVLSTPEGKNRSLSNWRRATKGKRKLTKIDGGYCSYHLQDFNPCCAVDGKHGICNYFIENEIETIDKEINDVSDKLHSDIKALKDLVGNAENITRFSEKYSVLTESIQY